MSWALHLRGRVRKNLRRFPVSYQQEIAGVLRELKDNPYAGDIIKLRDEHNLWRRRIGVYRLFFEIKISEKAIFVFRLERRNSKTYGKKR